MQVQNIYSLVAKSEKLISNINTLIESLNNFKVVLDTEDDVKIKEFVDSNKFVSNSLNFMRRDALKLQPIVLDLGYYIVSVNKAYKPGWKEVFKWNTKKKKKLKEQVPILFISPEAAEYKMLVIRALGKAITPEMKIKLRQIKRYDIEYEFVLKKSFWSRDVSNLIKLTEDAIFEYLGSDKDDSKVIWFSAGKGSNNGAKKEYLILNIYPSQYDIYKYT